MCANGESDSSTLYRRLRLYAIAGTLLVAASAPARGEAQQADPPPMAAGEDIGKKSEDPTTAAVRRIGRRMRQAQELMAQRQTAKQTQSLQATIGKELTELIADLEAATGAKGAAKGAAPAGAPSDEPVPDDGGGEPNDPNDRNEPDQARGANSSAAGTGSDESRIWGHLPSRLRQRMRTAGVEEFLPQYEQMLEAYYQRLADAP